MLPETKLQPDEETTSTGNPFGGRARKWLTFGAIIILCSVPFFRSYHLRDRPLEEDEIYWIGEAYYYHLAFEKMEWSHPDWQLLPSRENPALGKYIIGLGLQLNGLSVTNPDWLGVFYIIAKDRPNAWGNERDRAERQAVLDRMQPAVRDMAVNQGNFESPAAFATAARAIMLVFGAVAAVAVFLLMSFYSGRAAAFLAALLFALHPAVVAAYTEVGVDILAIALSLLAVLHFVLIERRVWCRCSRPGICRALVCIGGALSLTCAVGSKMNAVVVGFLGVVMCAFFIASFLRRRDAEAKESFEVTLALLILAGILFVASSPLNYPNPVKGVWSVYADQQRSLEVQKGIPAIRRPLQSLGERVRAITVLTAFHPAIFVLIVGAFFFQIVRARGAERQMPVIALWWLLAVVTVTAWLPFARARYALPVIAPSVILLCCAGDRVVGLLRRRSRANAAQIDG